MAIQTPHINCEDGAFAPTVLMPGDPMRSKLIAETFLENPVLVNNVRGVQGYTGTYQGKRVSVMASGMGMPSIGIYAHELFTACGVESIIRIGSAGMLNQSLHLRDIVAGMSAYTNSNFCQQYGYYGNAAPCCSFELLNKAVAAGERLGTPVVPGAIYSTDTFYDTTGTILVLQKLGVLAVEMEAASLYLTAAATGKQALCLCTISDNPINGDSLPAMDRQNSFTAMMKVALEIA